MAPSAITERAQPQNESVGVSAHGNNKFPDMKALSDYAHSKGLKLGTGSSPGPQTYARSKGSMGHEDQDARLYPSWGIDYPKYTCAASITLVLRHNW